MTTEFELVAIDGDAEQEQCRAMVWRFGEPQRAISSASVGGGMSTIDWVTNIGVTMNYRRSDLAVHAQSVATSLGLAGRGAALFTAADITRHQTAENEGVRCDVTVGISKPTWAADRDGTFTPWRPGTINIVIQLPVALEAGAAVNAVITATEAKTQALIENQTPGTGTASDAIVICWPSAGVEERFAGPRSAWGARLARATHQAVDAGIRAARP